MTRVLAPLGVPRLGLAAVGLTAVLVASSLASLSPVATPRAHAAGLGDVCADVQARASQFDGRIGVVVVDLTDGSHCEYGEGEVFTTASLYKLVLLAEGYAREAEGTFSWSDPILLLPEHGVDDSPQRQAQLPQTLTGEQAARIMITISDNASAVALRQHLGVEELAAFPAQIGLDETTLTPEEFSTTADDVALLLTRMARGLLVSPEASRAMVDLMLGQQIRDRLPVGIPEGVAVANKTGNLGSIAHDAGIVLAPGGTYVIVTLTETASAIGPAYTTMQVLSTLTFAAFAEPRVVQPWIPAEPPAVQVGLEELTANQPVVEVGVAAPSVDAPSSEAGGAEGGSSPLDGVGSFFGGLGDALAVSEPRPAQLAGVLGALALLPFFVVALRWRRRGPAAQALGPSSRPFGGGVYTSLPARVDPPPTSPQRADAATSAGDGGMRFGSRTRDADERPENNLTTTAPAVAPASTMTEMVEEEVAERPTRADVPLQPPPGSMHMQSEPAAASERLRRVATYFSNERQLIEEMATQIESETLPLAELLAHQASTMQLILSNLEERLRPLNEYADHEEANLSSLEDRIDSDGMEFIQRSFAEYVEGQRRRIDETRRQIDEQRDPFLDFRDDQRESVEIALSRFDEDFDALEQNLHEQRRVMMRILEGMRSDSFSSVLDFLAARQETLLAAAERGVTDPQTIAADLQELQKKVDIVPGQEQLRPLLETATESDRRLLSAAAAAGSQSLPGMTDALPGDALASDGLPPSMPQPANGGTDDDEELEPAAETVERASRRTVAKSGQ